MMKDSSSGSGSGSGGSSGSVSGSSSSSSSNSSNSNNGLLGITYSEFDNKVGPRLLYSYPSDVISSETFETLSDYVIVGKHLCNKIIAIKTGIIIISIVSSSLSSSFLSSLS